MAQATITTARRWRLASLAALALAARLAVEPDDTVRREITAAIA